MSDVTDGLAMDSYIMLLYRTPWPDRGSCSTSLYGCGVLLKCSSPVQDNAEQFHVLNNRRYLPTPQQLQTGRLVALFTQLR